MTSILKNRLITSAVIAALTATLLAGCGRKGDPLKPSDAAIAQAKEEKRSAPDAPTPNKKNPGKRFILDGLLD